MPHGSPQFTPRQLLDAARRAEAEGKSDVARQFYRHLVEQYGDTVEAAEALGGLARLGGGHGVHGLEALGAMPPRAAAGRRGFDRRSVAAGGGGYVVGRAVAALVSGLGWLTIAGALAALALGLWPELLQMAALPELRLGPDALLQAAMALPGGAIGVLCGQAARALFDMAAAARELAAIERTRAGGGPR